MRNLASKLIFSVIFFCILFVAFYAGLLFYLNSLQQGKALSYDILEIINKPKYKNAHWGIKVSDIKSKKIIYSLNTNELFPALSEAKILTIAVALDTFGANYRFKSSICYRGGLYMGQLKGDIVLLENGGLILIGENKKEKKAVNEINILAKKVASLGIRRIRGDVIIKSNMLASGEASYIRRQLIIALKTKDVEVDADNKTGAAVHYGRRVRIRTAKTAPQYSPPKADAPLAQKKHIKLKQIVSITSPTFSEIAREALKQNRNNIIKKLAVLLAIKSGQKPLKDGSLISPANIILLLETMANRPDYMVYRDAFPILENQYHGKIFAKQGIDLIQNNFKKGKGISANALAGYVAASSGKQIAFAICIKNIEISNNKDLVLSNKDLIKIAESIYRNQ